MVLSWLLTCIIIIIDLLAAHVPKIESSSQVLINATALRFKKTCYYINTQGQKAMFPDRYTVLSYCVNVF